MDIAVLALAGEPPRSPPGSAPSRFSCSASGPRRSGPFLWGLAVGLMGVASLVGLILPALDEGSTRRRWARARWACSSCWPRRAARFHRDPHIAGLRGAGVRRSVLVFAVLLVHSLPEGFAIGTAFASDTEGLALFVFLAIALQNIPEGTSVSIPMQGAGFGRAQQFWAAVLTSAPQPVGAVIAYLAVEQITGLLPLSFAFAAGAMLALVVVELLPQALAPGGRWKAVSASALGAALMLALAASAGVDAEQSAQSSCAGTDRALRPRPCRRTSQGGSSSTSESTAAPGSSRAWK